MNPIFAITQREINSYFSTPLAYIFIVCFLSLNGLFTFYLGNFYERGQADLLPFFGFHPWLYLFFIPALGMRLWAEERKIGTIELLLTLPITSFQAVLGKFLATWLFSGLSLLLTFPLWLTVNYLGTPDNGVIAAAYLGSWLMAGAFTAIACCFSASTNNQVIAFILSLLCSFFFVVSGFKMVLNSLQNWAPSVLIDTISSLSFLTHFDAISRGVLDLKNIAFFLVIISAWLFANTIIIEKNKVQ